MSAPPAAAPVPFSDTQRLSSAIGVARVICIVGVVYAHAWTGLSGEDLAAADHTPQGVLRWLLMELFGRSAVPLLGMISGWLAAGSAQGRTYGAFLASRARTILAPMVLWNGLALLLVCGAARAGLIPAPIPADWRDAVDELFSLTSPNDINVQMPFLRDLFVCMAAAPLLARARPALLAAVAAGALAWVLSGVSFPLLLRPAILVFFVAGVAVRRLRLEARAAALPLGAFVVPFLALAAAGAWLGVAASGPAAPPAWLSALADLALRFAAAGAFWGLAWRLAGRAPAGLLLRLEPFAFLLFCAHVTMIWLAGPFIGRVTGPLGSPLYPVFLVLQPPLALLATLGLGALLMRLAPVAARTLSGGRLCAAPRLHSRLTVRA